MMDERGHVAGEVECRTTYVATLLSHGFAQRRVFSETQNSLGSGVTVASFHEVFRVAARLETIVKGYATSDFGPCEVLADDFLR